MTTVSSSANGKVSVQRARLLAAQAARNELKLQQERKETVYTWEAAEALEAVIVAIREKLLSLPTKCAPQVVAANSIAEVKAILSGIVDECLTELGTLNPWKKGEKHGDEG